MVNRIVVGAGYGLKDWMIQRVTAVVMAVYTLVMFAVIVVVQPGDFEAWRGIFASGFIRLATFLFFVSLFYHAWIGVRDLWMDYVQATGVRLVLHSLTVLALVAYLGWAVSILWRL